MEKREARYSLHFKHLSLGKYDGADAFGTGCLEGPSGCLEGGASGQHIIYQYDVFALDGARIAGPERVLQLPQTTGPISAHLMRLAHTDQ